MSSRKIPPPKRRPSLAQLADSVADDAFRSAFETFMESVIKHHPKSRSWSRQFLKAWRRKLEWAERSERRERPS